MAPVLPYIMAATAVANIVQRNSAASQASAAQAQQQGALKTEAQAQLEQVPTVGQVAGSEYQSMADRGINLGPMATSGPLSPAVQEAINRRSRVVTGIQAGSTAQQAGIDAGLAGQRYAAASAGGDPFSLLFRLFTGPTSANPTGPQITPYVAPPSGTTAVDPNDPFAYTV